MTDQSHNWNAIIEAVRGQNAKGIAVRNGKKYTSVAVRNEVVRRHLGDGIGTETEIVQWATAKGEPIVVKATIRRTSDGAVLATGYAEEIRGQGNVNTTSALENAETSAIGRALANLGFNGGEFASVDELDAVERKREAMKEKPETPHDPETGEIILAGPTSIAANHGSAIRSAWEDGIRDGLPADATERQFFEACVAQLKTEWRKYKTIDGLNGGWAKYDDLLTRMQHDATDLWEDLMGIWQRAKDALEEAAETKAAEKAPPTISKATGEAILAGIHALKTVEACDMFEKGLRDGPNPGALAHPKIAAALQFKRSVLMGEADPVVMGEVRVG
jgi:hypothetical protein